MYNYEILERIQKEEQEGGKYDYNLSSKKKNACIQRGGFDSQE